MSKYIEFRHVATSASGKTKLWDVVSKEGGGRIGEVKWYGAWRKYCFFPLPNCVFEQVCLRDIAKFIEEKTFKHKYNQ